MKQYGQKCAAETYGSLEYAMRAMETAEAENEVATERAFPDGYVEIQVGVSVTTASLSILTQLQRLASNPHYNCATTCRFIASTLSINSLSSF